MGGGNTWALVTRMYEAGIIDLIRDRVNGGIPYCGWSAGGNVACRRCARRTTADRRTAVLQHLPGSSRSRRTLAAGTSGLNNETREDRLEEFLWYNKDEEVIGLPEGTALFVTGEQTAKSSVEDAEAHTGSARPRMEK